MCGEMKHTSLVLQYHFEHDNFITVRTYEAMTTIFAPLLNSASSTNSVPGRRLISHVTQSFCFLCFLFLFFVLKLKVCVREIEEIHEKQQ
jgi:hypothetical protein